VVCDFFFPLFGPGRVGDLAGEIDLPLQTTLPRWLVFHEGPSVPPSNALRQRMFLFLVGRGEGGALDPALGSTTSFHLVECFRRPLLSGFSRSAVVMEFFPGHSGEPKLGEEAQF